MDRFVLCTGNTGKITEIKELMPSSVTVLSLPDVGLGPELLETGDTLTDNALQKARFVHLHTGLPCLADDSGLEVDALGGAPGVHSARYAGDGKDASANMDELLRNLGPRMDRTARFRTVLAWVHGGGEDTFEGTVEGRILLSRRGAGGFGYDPIFVPNGFERTFAEMDLKEKNAISHRARAMRQWIAHVRPMMSEGADHDQASDDRA
ncbi:MAG: RdgB/HAM1 family non-canonical purine NTP pyrophosphatase [Flavobacteriales bacterium]|nr:RdgB/HAM1 family non-canonical purine NTP pyrophosphatase [Flavobacteriales bacterium]